MTEGEIVPVEALFKVLYRFENCKVGRPTYPEEINWQLITEYVNGPFHPIEDILEIVAGESKRKMMGKETTVHVRAVSRDDVTETSITIDREDSPT